MFAETTAGYQRIKGVSAYYEQRLPLFPFLCSVFSLFYFFSGFNLSTVYRVGYREVASHLWQWPCISTLPEQSKSSSFTLPGPPRSLNSSVVHQHCWNHSKISFFGKIRGQGLPLFLQDILRGALPQRRAAVAEPRRSPTLEIAQIKAIIIKVT